MFFKLTHRSSKSNARVGKVFTDRGEINTPIFMPVGTLGTVKGVFNHDLIDKINAEIILNSYELKKIYETLFDFYSTVTLFAKLRG